MIRKILENDFYRFFINFIAIFLIAWGIVSTLGIIKRNFELQTRLDSLERKNQELSDQNTQLAFEVEYYKTDEFVELEARDKLGLRKPGEKVIIFPDKVPRGAKFEAPKAEPSGKISVDNFQQWLYFLFGITPETG